MESLSVKVPLWSNSRYPFFYIFAHNRSFLVILENFNLLRTLELMVFGPLFPRIGPLQDPGTWYGINYTGTQMRQWDFQNKGTFTSPPWLSFVLKVPVCFLRPSVIYSVPCDWILQRAYLVWNPTTNKWFQNWTSL